MILTEEQRKTLEEAARPLIQWLNENTDPHARVVVGCDSAELFSGVSTVRTEDYIKD